MQRGLNFFRRHLEDSSERWRDLVQIEKPRFRYFDHEITEINTIATDLVSQVRENGIAMTSLARLGVSPTSRFVQQANQLKQTLALANERGGCCNAFIFSQSTLLAGYLQLFSWGLDERILNLVEHYLELPVAYHGMYFNRDVVNCEPVKAKLWHLDMEDYQSLKIIVYLNDVTDDSYGPLQYLTKEMSLDVVDRMKYKYGYIQDSLLQDYIPESEWKSCLGAAGTTILMDTANLLHRGKVPLTTDRFAMFFDYTSRTPKRPYYCKSSLPAYLLDVVAAQVSDLQKQSLLWR